MRPPGFGLEEGNGELVTTGREFLAASDFEALRFRDVGVQQRIQQAFAGTLFEAIGEQQDGGFLILGLPGVQEVVRSGEGVDVVRIHRARRLGLARGRDREDDQQQRRNQGPDQERNLPAHEMTLDLARRMKWWNDE